jgi:tyrosyl-tRNA synthetase
LAKILTTGLSSQILDEVNLHANPFPFWQRIFVPAGLVASTSEALRQIKGGGLKVNDATVIDEKAMLGLQDLTAEGVIKLSLGKKKHVLLRPV